LGGSSEHFQFDFFKYSASQSQALHSFAMTTQAWSKRKVDNSDSSSLMLVLLSLQTMSKKQCFHELI